MALTQQKILISQKPLNIEIVKEFKYLGITVKSRNCSFIPTFTYLINKANKAIYSLLSRLPIKLSPVKTMLKLFDTLTLVCVCVRVRVRVRVQMLYPEFLIIP